VPYVLPREAKKFSEISVGQMDNFYNQLVDSKDNYTEHWDCLRQILEQLYRQNPNNLHFGPEYHLTTSKGAKLNIFVTFLDYKGENKEARRDYCVIAQDENQKVVGDEYHRTRYNKELDFLDTWLIISVGDKGKGVATPIDLVGFNLLQREANSRNCEVQLNIYDASLDTLKGLKKSFRKTKDQNLTARIRELESQRLRWLALYGKGGKLGFTAGGKKIFMPNGVPQELESIRSIDVDRVGNSNGIIEGKETFVAQINTVGDKQDLRDERLSRFRKLIGEPS
jgi:hypothetical protein